ncbi:MAG: ABC transporter substrate-binding protein [Euryarchaeota archaeon]|nr:ABC transporter substrate-binding protein [Euryarchaeota archaeon]
MENKVLFAIVAVAIVVIAAIGGVMLLGGGNDANEPVVGEDTDFAGREIQAVTDLNGGIVAIGQDSFRWMTYFGLADRCVMIDINDRTNFMGKSFMYHGRALADVNESDANDFSHTNCGITVDDVANILTVEPSLVVVPFYFKTDHANEYRSLLDGGLNVVAIANIYTFLEPGSFEVVGDLKAQINLLSNVLNMEERGAELLNAIENTVQDIRAIAAQASTNVSAYIGSLAYNGAHGPDSSMAYYMPFALAGVKNIMANEDMDLNGSGVSTFSATKIKEGVQAAEAAGDEVLLFLDGTGLYMSTDNTAKGILQMFVGHDAYVAFPYIWTGMNFENVLISAYQVLKDAHGLLTEDQLEEKVNAVYDAFLGAHMSNRDIAANNIPAPSSPTSIYEDMNTMYVERRGNPVYGGIIISEEGTMTFSAML